MTGAVIFYRVQRSFCFSMSRFCCEGKASRDGGKVCTAAAVLMPAVLLLLMLPAAVCGLCDAEMASR